MSGRKGTGGRKPLPLGLHLIRNSIRPSRHGSREDAERAVRAARAEACPSAPSWLPPGAKAEWRRLAPELHRTGRLRKADRSMFSALCQAVSELRGAEESIAAELEAARAVLAGSEASPDEIERARTIVRYGARLIPGDRGLSRNPACMVASQAAKRIRELGTEFGLSPSSAMRFEYRSGRRGDDMEAFQNSHPKSPDYREPGGAS